MKTKYYIRSIIIGLTAFFAGFFIGKESTDKPPGTVTETKETTVDTIPYFAPMPKSELALGTHRYTLPTYRFLGGGSGGEPRCGKDSAIVELPVIQRHYADSTYEAWVSGPIDPRLDSLRVSVPTTVITKREWRPPKRWHIGPTIGFGYTPDGFSPYAGVSVTYSIYSW